ncbi:dipicolinic acid synthetase subunit A [Rossellomorea marisflavi]|uniref:Dipicolinate synthase subunit A n=1 Tax=Rossellomorea marisflavi TaxID=189381 RepID=A0A0J5TAG1_9BACI|nr:dipicolinic acid synthetase subunit A [Rossellomorea marisflavi]KMK96468.1 dipicolinate synthase subunit A [Rossellomorea marisflavi]KML06491.1 dipicolinate synthase subunit A [Rossellomorea marisflavi]KML32878.1 dipicolinate synthase subunit A [Rossellomorea marisflavi]KZE49861.1 dipicolinate synthase subunit A [Rossellomorea marisflavi]MCM2604564.1 dipicolinic acid synthetase subunit A [Rossellomorea marisflavi]
MLTGMHIAVLGGDARQLEIIRKLTELDAKISLVGFEQLDHAFTGATKEKMSEIDFSMMDAIILPVPGTNLQGEIETIFSNEKVVLTEEILSRTPDHCTIYSGITNDYLNGIVDASKRDLIQLFERDDVAIYNSIPTVEGTIMMAIQHTDFTIHGSNIVILGLGRVGMSVARTFHHLGGRVKVGARKTEHLARASEMGLDSFQLNQLDKHIGQCDICINTIPAPIITPGVIAKMPSHILVIDLASKPGGTDFRFAEKRGIKALLAPGLPGIVAPKTAGQILANVLCKLMDDRNKGKGSST